MSPHPRLLSRPTPHINQVPNVYLRTKLVPELEEYQRQLASPETQRRIGIPPAGRQQSADDRLRELKVWRERRGESRSPTSPPKQDRAKKYTAAAEYLRTHFAKLLARYEFKSPRDYDAFEALETRARKEGGALDDDDDDVDMDAEQSGDDGEDAMRRRARVVLSRAHQQERLEQILAIESRGFL